MDLNYAFFIRLQDTFKGKYLKLSGGMNNNIIKIAQKIKNTQINNEEENPFRITDMIKVSIHVDLS